MKSIPYQIKFLVAVTFLIGGIAHAQTLSQTESINSFSSTIKVNQDSSVDVDEVIVYSTGQSEHHGIYRNIRTINAHGKNMKVSGIAVVDENNSSYQFTVSNADNDVIQVKIGDPAVTFSGQKTYHLSYHAVNAVSSLEDLDEIYWNTTGNDWNMSIDSAVATVIIPSTATFMQSSCYLGLRGEKTTCQSEPLSNDGTNTYIFKTPRVLQPGEGMTVAVGFSKGVITPYKESFLEKYADLIGSIVFVIAVFSVMFTYWFRNWRDPKGTGIIVPQYDVPDGLTPMEVSAIVNEKIDANSISAEILYFATNGYLKIKQVEDTRGIFSKKDYELTMLKKMDLFLGEEKSYDTVLFYGLFRYDSEINSTNKLSSLKNVFYAKISRIKKGVGDLLLSKGYYKNLGKMKYSPRINDIILLVTLVFFCVIFFSAILQSIPVFISSISAIILLPVFWYLSPAKTEKGVATKEYLLGLKEYLQIAEKDRLAFHNAPEKKPEVFEKLLPFAMALGVDKAWAKEFEDIYVTPPTWYESASGTHFSTVTFGDSLHDFNSYSSSVLTTAPSSSYSGGSFGGSGGGGFSGGGGGGGGGGSW